MSEITTYSIFYDGLTEIRGLFHKSGRFDDSNSKLDEVVKLIAIHLFQRKQRDSKLSLTDLVQRYEVDATINFVQELRDAFDFVLLDNEFQNPDGSSIFGVNPRLALQDSDQELCFKLVMLVIGSVDNAFKTADREHHFDLLNEAFGHFVRDNFRSHIEDAQYMTPPEVVDFMCRIALNDLTHQKPLQKQITVIDPCCGVGSFLSTFYRMAKKEGGEHTINLFGQDKVDRMVRFSKINMMLFNAQNHQIVQGNSLVGNSPLAKLEGKVDLILTNPPFGARFSSHEVFTPFMTTYPLLYDLLREKNRNFTSELLFIDRCISLLKPNGIMLAVVPDSVISSKGLSATVRQRLSNHATVQMIVELPNVTFAQAGTRTKTHVLYVKKNGEVGKNNRRIFMGLSTNLGFEVKSRKGVPIKMIAGENDLPQIAEIYESLDHCDTIQNDVSVLSVNPSCVVVPSDDIVNQSWTPNHYNATRFQTIQNLRKRTAADVDLLPLSSIAQSVSKQRRREIVPLDAKCISVLHVMGDGVLNYEELAGYEPKHQGLRCEAGDVLFSKINPRIPRMLVVPEYERPLSCSTEFEILRPTSHLSNYAIMLLLLSPFSQKQILHLTSGTSSSHNRIKTQELQSVLMPVPRIGSARYEKLQQMVKKYAHAVETLNGMQRAVVALKPQVDSVLFNLLSTPEV